MRFVRSGVAAIALTIAGSAHAVFTNGGFEQNNLSGWTVGGGSNPGLSGTAPFTGANVQINAGTPGPASVVGRVVDARAPGIVLPRVGNFTAKVNDEASGARLTTLVQRDRITQADVDSSDGLPHLRFAFAPVLEDPAHAPAEQPYFYVVVRNVADGSVLFEQFAYSGQPGVTFQQEGQWKYLPFQNVDATLPASSVGQEIELTVIGADCSLGAHGGYVYVDGFGSAQVGTGAGQGQGTSVPVPVLAPGVLALLAVGLGGVGAVSWRRSKG
jgi:hypothetical protein